MKTGLKSQLVPRFFEDFPSGYVSPKLEGRDLGPRRRSVHAKAAIKKNEVVCVYGGKIVPVEEVKKLGREAIRLSVQVEDGFVIYSETEGVSDWFNHSCEPNVGMSGQITMVAIRDIKVGEEITFDYAFCDSADYDEFECQCGAPACRKKVTSKDWQLPRLQKEYLGYFSSYLQRKIRGG